MRYAYLVYDGPDVAAVFSERVPAFSYALEHGLHVNRHEVDTRHVEAFSGEVTWCIQFEESKEGHIKKVDYEVWGNGEDVPKNVIVEQPLGRYSKWYVRAPLQDGEHQAMDKAMALRIAKGNIDEASD